MGVGRTTPKHIRAYLDGYDMSGYSRSVGPLKWEYEEADLTCQMSDAVKGYLPGLASISPGTLNGVFDNTATTGLHVIASTVASRKLMIPIGIRAAPAAGDPVFMGYFVQTGYNGELVGPSVYANVPFGEWDISDLPAYDVPWGFLSHPKGAETGANSAAGIDDYGAATSYGGWLMYQAFAGDGLATVSVDDSADNSAWTALAGATSGELDFSNVQKGIVELGATATIRRYTRFQISFNTATTVTFALALCRRISA